MTRADRHLQTTAVEPKPGIAAEVHLQIAGVDHAGPKFTRHHHESLAVCAIAETLQIATAMTVFRARTPPLLIVIGA